MDRVCLIKVMTSSIRSSCSPARECRTRNAPERLLRSYEKWIAGRFRLSVREELIFLRRYCRNDRVLLRRLQQALQSHRSRLGLHRAGWLVSGASSAQRRPDRPRVE